MRTAAGVPSFHHRVIGPVVLGGRNLEGVPYDPDVP